MQHTAGNRAVMRFLQRCACDSGQPADALEADARRAERSLDGPTRRRVPCSCEHPVLQRASAHAAATALPTPPAALAEIIGSSGEPLPADVSAEMGERLGDDFTDVTVHTDAQAAASAAAVDARAYTVGSHVVFGAGEWSPSTPAGRRLLAHELTHVRQQRGMRRGTLQRQVASEPQRTALPSAMSDDALLREYSRVLRASDPATETYLLALEAEVERRAWRAMRPLVPHASSEPPRNQPQVLEAGLGPAAIVLALRLLVGGGEAAGGGAITQAAVIQAVETATTAGVGGGATAGATGAAATGELGLATVEGAGATATAETGGGLLATIETGAMASMATVGAFLAVLLLPGTANAPGMPPSPREKEMRKRGCTLTITPSAGVAAEGMGPIFCDAVVPGLPSWALGQEWIVTAADGDRARFDAIVGNVAFECKCGYASVLGYLESGTRGGERIGAGRLSELDEQRLRGLRVASKCGLLLRWYVSNRRLADFLNARWNFFPVVHWEEFEPCD
jgi:hypothetical protein